MDSIITKYERVKKLCENYRKNNEQDIKKEFINLYNDLVLFLIGKKDRYYGYIIMNFELRINFVNDMIAGVKVESSKFILEVNPLNLLKYSLQEIIFILCHEVEHLVLLHPVELQKRNPLNDKSKHLLLNYAMDASINEVLKKEVKEFKFLKVPDNCVTADVIKNMAKVDDIKDDESFAYYYELIKDLKIPKYYLFQDVSADSSAGLEEEIKNFVSKSISNMSRKARGNLPAYQKRNLDKLFSKPKITWQTVLRKYLGNVISDYKKTKTKLNRREPKRFDLSGKMPNHILKIVIAFDTSASINDANIREIANEINAITHSYNKEITLIQFDSNIKKVEKLKNLRNLDIIGGGGTSYQAVVDYINKDAYFRNAVLIWFTDGFGESEITKPKVYRNLWVILKNSNNLSLSVPYGKVMSL